MLLPPSFLPFLFLAFPHIWIIKFSLEFYSFSFGLSLHRYLLRLPSIVIYFIDIWHLIWFNDTKLFDIILEVLISNNFFDFFLLFDFLHLPLFVLDFIKIPRFSHFNHVICSDKLILILLIAFFI